MKSKLIDQGGERTFAIVFDTDDEVVSGLQRFATENALTASHLTGIGAFRDVVLGYFDWRRKDYNKIQVAEQVEVLSLLGDITFAEDGPKVHAHVVIGKSDGTAHGGHLLQGYVRPTLEVVLVESPAHLRRRHDSASGLALIDLDLGT